MRDVSGACGVFRALQYACNKDTNGSVIDIPCTVQYERGSADYSVITLKCSGAILEALEKMLKLYL